MSDACLRPIGVFFSSFISDSCRKDGCELHLDSIRRGCLLVVDSEKYAEAKGLSGAMCDLLVFCSQSGMLVSALEFKGGGVDASRVYDQLCAGSKLAQRAGPKDTKTRFIPLLIHKGKRLHANDYKRMNHYAVTFHGKGHKIVIERSHQSLVEIIRKHASSCE